MPASSTGRFYNFRSLVKAVHELFKTGLSILDIARVCRVDSELVRTALSCSPESCGSGFAPQRGSERFVIVSERGVPLGVESVFAESMSSPWIHGSSLSDGHSERIIDRVTHMGVDYGQIRIARLVWEEPTEFLTNR